MSDNAAAISAIDERIAAARENLRELIEQATAFSGATGEEFMSQRISEQEERLELLISQRDELSQSGSIKGKEK